MRFLLFNRIECLLIVDLDSNHSDSRNSNGSSLGLGAGYWGKLRKGGFSVAAGLHRDKAEYSSDLYSNDAYQSRCTVLRPYLQGSLYAPFHRKPPPRNPEEDAEFEEPPPEESSVRTTFVFTTKLSQAIPLSYQSQGVAGPGIGDGSAPYLYQGEGFPVAVQLGFHLGVSIGRVSLDHGLLFCPPISLKYSYLGPYISYQAGCGILLGPYKTAADRGK